MKTFLFLDSPQQNLAPLTDDCCIAMLPIAGKPLIAYTIEEIARAGLKDVVIVASSGAREVADFLGKGERWGMNFEYFPCRLQEHPAAVVGRYGPQPNTPLLLLKGDVLLAGLGDFLGRASALQGSMIVAGVNDQPAGLSVFRGDISALSRLPWPGATVTASSRPDHWLALEPDQYCALNNLADFHRASLRMAAGPFGDFKLAGWKQQSGLISGPGSSVNPSSIATQHCYVGKGCNINGKARLQGTVVVNDNCFIDRGATVENSVILPGTYIGSNLNVANALVRGNQIIRIDSGASYTVTDPFILASMNSGGLRGWMSAVGNRLLGLVMLVLSLPLWPIAAVRARRSSRPLVARKAYYSNRLLFDPATGWAPQEFCACQFSVEQPLLRSLPLLLAVVQGHLNVLGSRPREVGAVSSQQQPWEDVGYRTRCGLLGPAQLLLPAHAPAEEQLLSEIQFHHSRSLRGDLTYLLRGVAALFTSRAWLPKNPF